MTLPIEASGVHSCHAECPCQTGGKLLPDFVDSPVRRTCTHCGADWTGFDSWDDEPPCFCDLSPIP